MWSFEPSPKIAPLTARCVPVRETAARLQAVLSKIPVTRISDLTPLDELAFPVFAAVTPLARDLTTHLGKGPDAESARVSALMEAVERVSGESVEQAEVREASFEDLQREFPSAVVDPRTLDLPDDSAFHPELQCSWVRCHDLSRGEASWLPRDLVVSPPSEGVLREVDTNGLASGNNLLEATVHALCEVVERDVLSQLDFISLFDDAAAPPLVTPRIAVSSMPSSTVPWFERIAAAGLETVVHDLTGEIGVATFRVTIVDPSFPTASGPALIRTPGFGTHPNAELALLRAITEALQSRLGLIHAARDSYNTGPSSQRSHGWVMQSNRLLAGPELDFARVPSRENSDLKEDLEFLLERLEVNGFEQVIACDLTRVDLGLSVVRVRVPGLACFQVNRRRVGPRCLRHLL